MFKKLIEKTIEGVFDRLKEDDSTIKIIEIPQTCECSDKLEDLVKDRAELNKELGILKRSALAAEKKLATAELQYKNTLEDIKHAQKLLDEKAKLEKERHEFESKRNAEQEIQKIRKEYSDKLENELMVERKKMEKFMEQVMNALPNVNARLRINSNE